MNPLPAAVLAALAICARHVTVTLNYGIDTDKACLKTASCDQVINGVAPQQWDTAYGKCRAIYLKAEKIQDQAAQREWNAEEARERAKAARAAKKDQSVLDAALAALKREETL